MKKVTLLFLFLFLNGCSLTTLSVKGAETADTALAVHEWGICQAATYGAIKRRYGETDKAAALVILCRGTTGKGLVKESDD